jgi:hypothetical protein
MKNLKLISQTLIIIIIASLFACEEDVTNVDVPLVQPQLVVASFLHPDSDSNRLYLSWSTPIFHNSDMQHHDEANAKVYIEKDGIEYKLHYNSGFYSIHKNQMSVEVGKTYKLKILCDNSETLIAETKIPPKPVFEISYSGKDSIPSQKGMSAYEYVYYVKLKVHNPDPKGYYRIFASGIVETGMPPPNNIATVILSLAGKENRLFYGDYEGTLLLSYQANMYISNNTVLKKIIIKIDKADETFYLYNHALEHYSDIDVFTEPTQVYSNIEHAFGVFCSYNTKTDSLAL